MAFDPERHHRRSIRLTGYDYGQAGVYSVTICAQDRACLMGVIGEGVLEPTDAGRMVQAYWFAIPQRFPSVLLDAFALMPNHLHGIVVLGGRAESRSPDLRYGSNDFADGSTSAAELHLPLVGAPWPIGDLEVDHRNPNLSTIIQWFKSITTRDYARGVRESNWPPFRDRLWQRNYYEHIVRSDAALDRIRRYVFENPLRWATDEENPKRLP